MKIYISIMLLVLLLGCKTNDIEGNQVEYTLIYTSNPKKNDQWKLENKAQEIFPGTLRKGISAVRTERPMSGRHIRFVAKRDFSKKPLNLINIGIELKKRLTSYGVNLPDKIVLKTYGETLELP